MNNVRHNLLFSFFSCWFLLKTFFSLTQDERHTLKSGLRGKCFTKITKLLCWNEKSFSYVNYYDSNHLIKWQLLPSIQSMMFECVICGSINGIVAWILMCSITHTLGREFYYLVLGAKRLKLAIHNMNCQSVSKDIVPSETCQSTFCMVDCTNLSSKRRMLHF